MGEKWGQNTESNWRGKKVLKRQTLFKGLKQAAY